MSNAQQTETETAKEAKKVSQIKFKVPDEQLEDLIHKYCRDFTQWAREDRFDPITGRDEEIDQAILILLQKGRKNVALLAPAGVGKTALCAGLAQKIVANEVPEYLKDARLLEIDLAAMSGGTLGPAEFQGRFLPLCKGIAERYHDPSYPKVVLFIDEIHQVMPSCEGSAYKGLSEVMKPYLTVGDLHIIGATPLMNSVFTLRSTPPWIAASRKFSSLSRPFRKRSRSSKTSRRATKNTTNYSAVTKRSKLSST